jgi:plasmid maintenance system antidote protein VapI
MAKKGFNQKTLSRKSKVHPSTISNFLNERFCISPSTATKLAETLDSKIEDLFEIQINKKEVNKK